jgi:hypothetical protein
MPNTPRGRANAERPNRGVPWVASWQCLGGAERGRLEGSNCKPGWKKALKEPLVQRVSTDVSVLISFDLLHRCLFSIWWLGQCNSSRRIMVTFPAGRHTGQSQRFHPTKEACPFPALAECGDSLHGTKSPIPS